MTTLPREQKETSPTLFRANPILHRLSKVQERAESNTATYAGISSKVCFFLALTLVGLIAQLLVSNAYVNEPVWQTLSIQKFTFTLTKIETIIFAAVTIVGFICQLVGVFARRTVPFTGSVYAASQGYFISFLVFKVLKGYEYLGLEALLLTVAVIAVMSWLYTSGKIQVNEKFRTILFSLLIGSIAVGLFSFIGYLIPFTRPFVQAMTQNVGLAIAMDVLGIVIASLFLVSDFHVIDTCVRDGYPRNYEWFAAFGLVFTVIWLYVKILDLIMRIAGNSKSK